EPQLGPGPQQRVVHGALHVDPGEVLAEGPGTRLGQPLAALPRLRGAVLAQRPALQVVEDAVQRVLADHALALRRQGGKALRLVDDLLLLERLAELGE